MSKKSVFSWQIIEFLNDLLEFFENLLEFFFGLSFFGLEFFSKCPKKKPVYKSSYEVDLKYLFLLLLSKIARKKCLLKIAEISS